MVTEEEALQAAAEIYAEAKIRIATEKAIREAQRQLAENEDAPAAGGHRHEGANQNPGRN